MTRFIQQRIGNRRIEERLTAWDRLAQAIKDRELHGSTTHREDRVRTAAQHAQNVWGHTAA